MKLKRGSILIVIFAAVFVLSSCGGEERSKSVADAESYDELTMGYDEDFDEYWDDKDSYEERYREWKEHEEWRDKEVDKFKTAEEYADYYHDEYIELYMEQYYHEDWYDEGVMLEQSYLDAIDHWENNQPWPEPKK